MCNMEYYDDKRRCRCIVKPTKAVIIKGFAGIPDKTLLDITSFRDLEIRFKQGQLLGNILVRHCVVLTMISSLRNRVLSPYVVMHSEIFLTLCCNVCTLYIYIFT